ncbi:MAG: DUF475 domain-containing protein, partial [Candidatus Sericytochromatia bacterium]
MSQFRGSFIFTIVSLILASAWAYFKVGTPEAIGQAVLIAVILGILEVSLSFDNAVVNAAVLETMDEVWQKRFLTWGIMIAVFGMRIVFPVVIVSVVAWIDPLSVVQIALTNPDKYAEYLTSSHAAISAFGGMFLLMVFLKFILDPEKEIHWIEPLEKALVKVGKLESFEILLAILLLIGTSYLATGGHHGHEAQAAVSASEHELSILKERITIFLSGLAGLVTYIFIDSLASSLESSEAATLESGIKKAGFAAFLYLEVLDASFSFDGVIGAFAITKDIVIIALGLGIGAMFVRSLTLYLVK